MPIIGPSFNRSVRNAFKKGPEKEYSSTYLNDILVNWRDVETRLRHAALFAFVAAAFGELLIQGRVTKVQLAGLTVNSLSIFQKITPVVVSYLIYDICNYIVIISTYRALYDEMVGFLYPAIRSEQLNAAAAPPMSLYFGEYSWILYDNSHSSWPFLILGLIRPFIIIGAPLAYIIHQFAHLAAINQDDGLFWVSVGLTSLLIVASLRVLFSWLSS